MGDVPSAVTSREASRYSKASTSKGLRGTQRKR
jgi:hypothetical protein